MRLRLGRLTGRIVPSVLASVLSAALAAAPAAAAEYRVTMTSVEDPVLDKVLNASSTLIELQDRPPEDVTALRRRAEEDLGRLQKALRAAGYYDGTVTIKVDGQIIGDPAATPLQNYQDSAKRTLPVGISIAPGPLYKLGRITVTGAESLTPKLTLKLKTGAPARAADIVAERRTLLDQVMAAGHPFALATLKPATVDHAAHTLDIAFAVDPGPAATMGTVTVSGLDRVDKNFIAHRAWFPPGTKYSPAALDGLRGDLRSLDLFSSVKVKPGTALDAQGRLPVSVELVERERHFIGFGANYSTNDGAGATAYWGDRNLFGGGERLKLQADVSGIEAQGHGLAGADYTLTTNFRTPDFLTLHQDFVTNLVITDEHDPDTFDKRGLTLDTGVERKIGKTLKVNAGWEVEGARIDDHETTSNFLLDGPTGSIAWDTTNDLLNPTKGVRASLGGEAFPTWFGSNENVFTTKATASSYLNLIGSGDLVLAGRVGVASVFGSSLENLPADRRLYAGGGGSVRGYTFRSISPKDSDGNLSGGRSEIDGSIELRYRFLDNFGIVPFFDAGTVSRHAMPGFDQPVQYAAGIGFRYYTNFGPIRADIATPLNPRKGDDPVAFYVSIGQSF